MVLSLAPNTRSMGSAKSRNTAVSTTAAATSMVMLLPMIRSDSARFPRPSSMDARGAPPIAISAAKAEITMMMGRHTPTPVRASLPTVSTGCMWPMYTRSTRLYSMLTIWEVMVGSARENSSRPTGPVPRSTFLRFIPAMLLSALVPLWQTPGPAACPACAALPPSARKRSAASSLPGCPGPPGPAALPPP